MSDWQSDLKAKVEILKRTVAILYAHELGDSRVTQDSFEGVFGEMLDPLQSLVGQMSKMDDEIQELVQRIDESADDEAEDED